MAWAWFFLRKNAVHSNLISIFVMFCVESQATAASVGTLANSLVEPLKIKEKMNFNYSKKLFLSLSLAFILMTIIGTISHEFGHFISAKIL